VPREEDASVLDRSQGAFSEASAWVYYAYQ
jgi:hypothetical protein